MNDAEIRYLTRQILHPLYTKLSSEFWWDKGYEHHFSQFCQKTYWPGRAEEMMLVALDVLDNHDTVDE